MAPAQTPAAELIRGRRTINDFLPDRPPEELILQAIDLARWAPNHKHTEPWRFHLIGPETAAAIVVLNTRLVLEQKGPGAAEDKRRRWSAVPGWLAVSSARSDDELRDREDYAACCCAVQNLSLFLWSEGVGVKWSTGDVTRHEDLYRLLSIDPQQRRVVGLFWFGYPQRIPSQNRRRGEELIDRLP